MYKFYDRFWSKDYLSNKPGKDGLEAEKVWKYLEKYEHGEANGIKNHLKLVPIKACFPKLCTTSMLWAFISHL